MFAAAAAAAPAGSGVGATPGRGGRGSQPEPKSRFSGQDPSGFSRDPTSLRCPGGGAGGGFPGNAPAPGADPSHCPGTLRASSGGRAGAAIVHTERRILDSEIEFAQVHLVGRKRKTLGIRKFALAVTNFSFP